MLSPDGTTSSAPSDLPGSSGSAEGNDSTKVETSDESRRWPRKLADRLCRFSIRLGSRYAGRLGWLSLCLGIAAAGGIAFHLWTFVINDPPVYCDRCTKIAVQHEHRWARVSGAHRDRFAEPVRIEVHLCERHAAEDAADDHWMTGIFQQFGRTFLVSPTFHAIALIGGIAAFAGGLTFFGRPGESDGLPRSEEDVDPSESDYWVDLADAESLLPIGRICCAFLYILGTEVIVVAALRQEVPLMLTMLYMTAIVPFIYSGRCFGFCRRWLSPLPD